MISGNTGNGVVITGSTSSGNVVQGNIIGLDVGGAKAIPNANGVVLAAGASNNTIGGAIVAARDVISGNTGAGILMTGAGTSGNLIEGEYVGLNSSGTAALGNAEGVVVNAGAASNSIGGSSVSNRNIISGNVADNVHVVGAGTINNVIVGDTIGLNADGSASLGGGQAVTGGLVIEDGATGTTVGGVASTSVNVIGGNSGPGVLIRGMSSSTVGTAASANLVEGNFVGTNLGGTAGVPNAGGGIVLSNGTTNNTVGGTAGGLARNVVSGNLGAGISLIGAGVTGNAVQANLIGLQSDGATALGNQNDGVYINGASNNTIGGSVSGRGEHGRLQRPVGRFLERRHGRFHQPQLVLLERRPGDRPRAPGRESKLRHPAGRWTQ